MFRLPFIIIMLITSMTSFSSPKVNELFPRTYVESHRMGEKAIYELMAEIALPDPDKRIRNMLLRSLNEAGGLPFFGNNNTFLRIKLKPDKAIDEYGSEKVEYAVNLVFVVDFEGNNSRYLVIAHTVMTGTAGITIWRKNAGNWSRVFITSDGPSHGAAGWLRKTINGIDFIGFYPNYTCFSWNKLTKRFVAHAFVENNPGRVVVPDDTVRLAPKLIEVNGTGSVLKLLAAPKIGAEIIGELSVTNKIWKLGTKGKFILVLVPKELNGEWYSAFKGKSWQLGWIKNR